MLRPHGKHKRRFAIFLTCLSSLLIAPVIASKCRFACFRFLFTTLFFSFWDISTMLLYFTYFYDQCCECSPHGLFFAVDHTFLVCKSYIDWIYIYICIYLIYVYIYITTNYNWNFIEVWQTTRENNNKIPVVFFSFHCHSVTSLVVFGLFIKKMRSSDRRTEPGWG